jgi:hypothetical protein
VQLVFGDFRKLAQEDARVLWRHSELVGACEEAVGLVGEIDRHGLSRAVVPANRLRAPCGTAILRGCRPANRPGMNWSGGPDPPRVISIIRADSVSGHGYRHDAFQLSAG